MLMPMQMLLLMLMQMLMQMLMPMIQKSMIWAGQRSSTLGSVFLACGIIKRDFGTKKAKRPNMTMTHYLQYKTFVFMVPRPPKHL